MLRIMSKFRIEIVEDDELYRYDDVGIRQDIGLGGGLGWAIKWQWGERGPQEFRKQLKY